MGSWLPGLAIYGTRTLTVTTGRGHFECLCPLGVEIPPLYTLHFRVHSSLLAPLNPPPPPPRTPSSSSLPVGAPFPPSNAAVIEPPHCAPRLRHRYLLAPHFNPRTLRLQVYLINEGRDGLPLTTQAVFRHTMQAVRRAAYLVSPTAIPSPLALRARADFQHSLDNQMHVIHTFNMTVSPILSDSPPRRPRWSWCRPLLHCTT